MKSSRLVTVGLALAAAGLMGVAMTGCGGNAGRREGAQAAEAKPQTKATPSDPAEGPGKGMAAIKQAADAGKYLFVFFSKTDDAPTQAMRKVFDQAMEKVADRAQGVAVKITDSSEKDIVDKFDLSRAPMPMVLALAPNGAITGGFPDKLEEKELLDAFATPCTEKVMKSLQDGKLVFVCVQNAKTDSSDAALQGVRDFKTDARFASATEIVTLDPSDSKEASFLTDLKVASNTTVATTVFIVPPGQAIAQIAGPTNKDQLVELLSKANTSCGPGGCGPGGCGPKK